MISAKKISWGKTEQELHFLKNKEKFQLILVPKLILLWKKKEFQNQNRKKITNNCRTSRILECFRLVFTWKKNTNKKSFTWITSLCFQNASINDSSTVSVHNTPCHRTGICVVYSCCGCVDVCAASRIVWRPFRRCYTSTVFLPCEFAHGMSDAASPRTSFDSTRICRVCCPCRSFHVAANITTHWSSFRRCYRCETFFFFTAKGHPPPD